MSEREREREKVKLDGRDTTTPAEVTKLPDPTNLWGLIYRLAARAINRDGVLVVAMIAIVGALLYGNWRIEAQHRADAQIAHQEFQAVLKDMVQEQRSSNDELVKIGAALGQHLEHDERRERGGHR